MSIDNDRTLKFEIDGDESLNVQDVTCKYITENEASSFFNFGDKHAINIMHVNCRSIKKNFGPLTNLLNMISAPLTAIAVTQKRG